MMLSKHAIPLSARISLNSVRVRPLLSLSSSHIRSVNSASMGRHSHTSTATLVPPVGGHLTTPTTDVSACVMYILNCLCLAAAVGLDVFRRQKPDTDVVWAASLRHSSGALSPFDGRWQRKAEEAYAVAAKTQDSAERRYNQHARDLRRIS